jgi:hypothetical protein
MGVAFGMGAEKADLGTLGLTLQIEDASTNDNFQFTEGINTVIFEYKLSS